MKDVVKKMKKSNFLQGAFIASFGIVFCKILGVLYVIPFYSMIGDKAGALYGYGYNMYSIVVSLSSAGIPFAISRLISEYNTLGFYNTKNKVFEIAKRMIFFASLVLFLLIFIFAGVLAKIIVGDVVGANSVSDVSFVIRATSIVLLFIPLVSVYRGYFQGHRLIKTSIASTVLEQVIRVVIILVGVFMMMKVFKLPVKLSVGLACLASSIGSLCSYIYLRKRVKKNSGEFVNSLGNVSEPKITKKMVIKKIIMYALPFIAIDITKSIYNAVDTLSLVKILVSSFNFSAVDAEVIVSVISTWGLKINMVIIALVTGLMTSLVPNLSSSMVSFSKRDISLKINSTYQIILFLVIPMSIGLSFLSGPIWNVFYGYSFYGALTYKYLAFVSLATVLFTASVTISQVMKNDRVVFISLIVGILFKVIFNVPLLYSFNSLGLPVFYGAISATIIGMMITFLINFIYVKKSYGINFEQTTKELINILIASMVMLVVLYLFKLFIPYNVSSRLGSIIIIIIYSLIGAFTYLMIMYKMGTIKMILKDVNKEGDIYEK